MEIAEIVMNPVRQRIFQYLLVHETGTVKDIRKALPDVPSASLYRHMKILTDNAVLTVVGRIDFFRLVHYCCTSLFLLAVSWNMLIAATRTKNITAFA